MLRRRYIQEVLAVQWRYLVAGPGHDQMDLMGHLEETMFLLVHFDH